MTDTTETPAVSEETTDVAKDIETPTSKPEPKNTEKSNKKTSPTAAVSGPVDDVRLSAIVFKNMARKKSLSVHHLQRRLVELGFDEAGADKDGYFGDLTANSISKWQKAQGREAAGVLSYEDLVSIFDGDDAVRVGY